MWAFDAPNLVTQNETEYLQTGYSPSLGFLLDSTRNLPLPSRGNASSSPAPNAGFGWQEVASPHKRGDRLGGGMDHSGFRRPSHTGSSSPCYRDRWNPQRVVDDAGRKVEGGADHRSRRVLWEPKAFVAQVKTHDTVWGCKLPATRS